MRGTVRAPAQVAGRETVSSQDQLPRIGPGERADRRWLWHRWLTATFLGETLGFLLPVIVVVLAIDGWDAGPQLVVLLIAGAGEGAALGAAQSLVLRRVLPGFPSAAWTFRTALAASLAWAIGLAPSELAGTWQDWPALVLVTVAIPAGLVLLASIGVAQWSVLRRLLPGTARWIGWTALAWLAGLGTFLTVATPLWQPGQPLWLTVLIGAVAGSLMALAMAAVTGWGLVRMIFPAPPVAASAADRVRSRRHRGGR
jgi:hypothetical protein